MERHEKVRSACAYRLAQHGDLLFTYIYTLMQASHCIFFSESLSLRTYSHFRLAPKPKPKRSKYLIFPSHSIPRVNRTKQKKRKKKKKAALALSLLLLRSLILGDGKKHISYGWSWLHWQPHGSSAPLRWIQGRRRRQSRQLL